MKIIRPVIITDDLFTSCNLPEDDEGVYSPAATYAVGSRVLVLATHRIYQSNIGSNLDKNPPDNLDPPDNDNPAPWKDMGATNKWRAFDQTVGNQAEHATVLEYGMTPGLIVDALGFQNLDAVEATIIMTDDIEGEVYNQTLDLISTANVFDWYDYFFEPIMKIQAAVLWDLPPYPDATITISINNGESTVKCGEIITGQQREIGRTKWGIQAGITDYSLKKSDETGSFTIQTRAYSKTMSCNLRLRSFEIDDIQRVLAEHRATPMVWVGVDDYGAFNVYGFYRDFQIVMSYLKYADCSLEIEGLT